MLCLLRAEVKGANAVTVLSISSLSGDASSIPIVALVGLRLLEWWSVKGTGKAGLP